MQRNKKGKAKARSAPGQEEPALWVEGYHRRYAAPGFMSPPLVQRKSKSELEKMHLKALDHFADSSERASTLAKEIATKKRKHAEAALGIQRSAGPTQEVSRRAARNQEESGSSSSPMDTRSASARKAEREAKRDTNHSTPILETRGIDKVNIITQ